MSEARRSSAVKMVVSTRRMIGQMSSSAGQLLDGDVLVGVVFAGEHIKGEALGGFVEHALRLLGLLEQVGDLRERGDAGDDALAEQAGDLVEHHQLRGVGDGDHEAVVVLLERHEVVAEHHVDRHGLEELVLDLEVLQVDELERDSGAQERSARSALGERVVGERGCYGGSHLVQTPCVASVQ